MENPNDNLNNKDDNLPQVTDMPENAPEDSAEIADSSEIPEHLHSAKEPRFSPRTRKILEFVVGFAAAGLIFGCMFIFTNSTDGLLRNLFLVVFLAAMFGPRYFERKYETTFPSYRKGLLIGCAIMLVTFVLYMWATGGFTSTPKA